MSMTFDKDNNFYYTINDGGAYKYNFNTSSYTDYNSQFNENQSYGIALDASNKIAVMNDNSSNNSGIRTVANIGEGSQNINNFGYGLFKFGPRGNAPGNYNHHRIMQVMPSGNILVPDMNNNRVCIVGSTPVGPVEDLSIYNVTNLEWGSGNQGLRTATRTNLLTWYDATVPSSYTTLRLSGYPTQVTKWNDLTGNGYHLVYNSNSLFAAGPQVGSNINTLTAFDFDLDRGLRSESSVPLADAITIFMVIKNKGDNLNPYGNFMHHGNRDTDWSIERNGMSADVKFESGNNSNVAFPLAGGYNYILIGRLSKNSNKREFWRYSDGDTATFRSATTPIQISPSLSKSIFVGKADNASYNESCNSLIGEIIYYNAAISDEDIDSNRVYLQKKWFERSSLSTYKQNISFTMPLKPSNVTYKYRYELISNDVVIKTSVIDWVSNQTTTILNDNLNFSTLYTYKVSLVDSDNTQVLTTGVTSGSFTTLAQ
jgi:hypothetical protein